MANEVPAERRSMLTERLYYALKPCIPWHLRMALRRVVARRQWKSHQSTWPINESASCPPEGWRGWPDGKKFAVVLTHDVEGPEGLAKCRQLAEVEMKLGFRSSFNLIPAGPYSVPPTLRAWLTANGFEVGVHDLKHDGHLFSSRHRFGPKAVQINNYLRDWGAVGFRSGFMLRNLNWFHDLDLRYDSSTFDTDPFEMQPTGVDTIFPFWIPSPPASADSKNLFPTQVDKTTARTRGGYVELPYTLPQDSTLFLVLGETTPDIWTRKLDWIARHGGMALVNVHPDYLKLEHEAVTDRTFPIKFYEDLLVHIRSRYQEEFWPALPKQVAEHTLRFVLNSPSHRHGESS